MSTNGTGWVYLLDPLLEGHQRRLAARNDITKALLWWLETVIPTWKPELFVIIREYKKVTILLRVKNSTAFATDDEFDRNKRWIASS